jgi:septal ring factor EnvC (AmiA/AmiB activator)
MPVLDLTININITILVVLTGLAALIGFGLRSRQLAKKNRQITQLEKEVVQVSAEILQVQKEYYELELRMKDLNIPVIPIRQNVTATIAKDNDPKKDETDSPSGDKNISNRTA